MEPLNNFTISVNSAGGGAGGDAGGGGFRILPKDFFSSGISGDFRNLYFCTVFESLEQQKLYCHKDVVDQMSQKLCICNGLEPIELKQNCSCTVWSF